MSKKLYGNLNNTTVEINKLYAQNNNSSVNLNKLYIKDSSGLARCVFNKNSGIIFQDNCTGYEVTDLWNVTGDAFYTVDTSISGENALFFLSGALIIPNNPGNSFIMDLDCRGTNYRAWFQFRMSSSPTTDSNYISIYTNSCSSDTESSAPIHTTNFPYNSAYGHIQIKRDNNQWEVYENNVLKGTAIVDCTNYPYILLTGTYSHYIKNIIVQEA